MSACEMCGGEGSVPYLDAQGGAEEEPCPSCSDCPICGFPGDHLGCRADFERDQAGDR